MLDSNEKIIKHKIGLLNLAQELGLTTYQFLHARYVFRLPLWKRGIEGDLKGLDTARRL
jgi:hypothetical protein